MLVVERPIAFNSNPALEAMIPLPMPLITPPGTRTYFILAAWGSIIIERSNENESNPAVGKRINLSD
jgi:hypothetical protein